MNSKTRRQFIRHGLASVASLAISPLLAGNLSSSSKSPLFKVSLGQWSLHHTIQSGKLDPLDFPVIARKDYGLDAVEYVNQLFMDKSKDKAFLTELKKRADDNGVKSLVIMVDKEGELGHPDAGERKKAVESHYKWVDAAKFLGCHSLRVNAHSKGNYDDQMKYCAEGLEKLSFYAAERKMNIIVENHGGMSSRGDWLASLMKKVNKKNFGTMPDFDNFSLEDGTRYDRYKGMQEIIPWAKSVSSKSYDFDETGNETTIDFKRICKIVVDAGYHGYISAEYEGKNMSEPDGLRATIKLLERVREELS